MRDNIFRLINKLVEQKKSRDYLWRVFCNGKTSTDDEKLLKRKAKREFDISSEAEMTLMECLHIMTKDVRRFRDDD